MKRRKPSSRRIVATLIGVVSLGALVVGSALLFTPSTRSDGPPFAPLNDNVTQATVLSAQATTNAMDQADDNRRATARAITGDRTTKVLYPSPPPDAPADISTVEAQSIPVPTGISALEQDPTRHKMVYSYSDNMWLGHLNGVAVVVLAGLKWDDPGGGLYSHPGQGMVLVEVDGQKDEVYLTPSRSGEVKLTAANGTCLTLATIPDVGTIKETPTGDIFYFDVATRQWSCSKK